MAPVHFLHHHTSSRHWLGCLYMHSAFALHSDVSSSTRSLYTSTPGKRTGSHHHSCIHLLHTKLTPSSKPAHTVSMATNNMGANTLASTDKIQTRCTSGTCNGTVLVAWQLCYSASTMCISRHMKHQRSARGPATQSHQNFCPRILWAVQGHDVQQFMQCSCNHHRRSGTAAGAPCVAWPPGHNKDCFRGMLHNRRKRALMRPPAPQPTPRKPPPSASPTRPLHRAAPQRRPASTMSLPTDTGIDTTPTLLD